MVFDSCTPLFFARSLHVWTTDAAVLSACDASWLETPTGIWLPPDLLCGITLGRLLFLNVFSCQAVGPQGTPQSGSLPGRFGGKGGSAQQIREGVRAATAHGGFGIECCGATPTSRGCRPRLRPLLPCKCGIDGLTPSSLAHISGKIFSYENRLSNSPQSYASLNALTLKCAFGWTSSPRPSREILTAPPPCTISTPLCE